MKKVKEFRPRAVDYQTRHGSSVTLPDQSLSIKEIVKRYVRGVPVDVLQRDAVYVDQSDHDLEALSRMDFGQKAEYAAELAAQAKELQSELEELEASEKERKATIAKEQQKAWEAKVREAASGGAAPGKGPEGPGA